MMKDREEWWGRMRRKCCRDSERDGAAQSKKSDEKERQEGTWGVQYRARKIVSCVCVCVCFIMANDINDFVCLRVTV